MADIFISYSRPDRARAARLAAALEKAGYSVWWDMNLTGGAQFSKETGEKLNEARAVVVCWSKTSVDSMWVADEATVGRTKKNLVPIAIDAVEPPLGFGQIHAIDFSGWTGEPGEACFLQLNKSLASVLDRAPADIAPSSKWRRALHGARRRWRGAAIAAAVAAGLVVAALFIAGRDPPPTEIASNAIAVLPFVNAGDDRDDYLSEGIADELRDQLGRVAGLQVAARASSVAVREEEMGAGEIAGKLGVGRLIEGSLVKQGGRLRISVRVVDGATGFQTWSRSFDREAGDLLDIQQEIAAAVVAAVAGDEEAPPPVAADFTAYDKMLLARHYEQEVRDAQIVDEIKLARAINLYRGAVAADPSSALAHSRLAGALLYAGDAEAAEPEIRLALDLDPDLSEVQYTLGLFYFARGKPGVGAAFARAVELNPNNADALSELAFQKWGYDFAPLAEVEDLFRRAVALDPMSQARYSKLGYFLGVTGQRDKALGVVAEMTGRFPDSGGAYSAIAQIFEQTGDFDLAIAAAKKALALSPENEDYKAQIAELYAEIGDFRTAARFEPEPGLGQLFWRRDYERLIDLAEERVIDQPEDVQIWRLLAVAYSAEGDYAQAVRALQIAGLPYTEESREYRLGGDQDAMATYAAALAELGREEEAREAADWTAAIMTAFIESGADQGAWAYPHLACALAVLGRDDEAMAALARADDGSALPRYPCVRDHTCFRRFEDDPRYRAIVAAVEQRQAQLRARVAAMDAN